MGITVIEKKIPQVNRVKLTALTVLGLVLAGLAVAIAIVNPIVLMARRNTRIAPGSPVLEVLKKKLHGVRVETYLFNITNADRFANGLDYKLKVQEVGPFTYIESRVNEDLELDEEAGVLRYTPRTNVTFAPELSIGDPRDVNVTMPNIALMSMTSMLSSHSSWAQIPFNLLARRLRAKAIVNIDAHNYLWGYEEPLIRFGNTVMPGWISFEKMGILDRLYDQSVTSRLEVGISDEDKFRIRTINGLGGMKALDYEDPRKRTKCNTFIDTYEGIFYPPGMTPDSKIRIWRNVMCRILEIDYVGDKYLDYNPQALVYKISNRTYDYNPDKACLCENNRACYNGVSDLSPCFFGLPLAISQAHFLDGEPRLFRKVDGLRPNEKDHGSQILVDPTTGIVLGTRFTVQVNVVLNDVSFNSEAAPFTNMVLPIAYFKIVQSELPNKTKADLKLVSYYLPKIQLAGEIILFVAGLVLIGFCFGQIFWHTLMFPSKGMAFTVPEDQKNVKPSVEVPLMVSGNS